MLQLAGCKNIQGNDSKQAPGLDIHEMGGCRMGKDPKTSLLNKYNQFHTLSECICYGWRRDGFNQHAKSFLNFYGVYGKSR